MNYSLLLKGLLFLPILILGCCSSIFAQNDDNATVRKIDRLVMELKTKGNIPGLSVTVVRDGKQFIKKNYGYANIADSTAVSDNTLFEIGSNTKAFTALGILWLERNGLLDLNDNVNKFLPWFNLPYIDNHNKRIFPEIKIRNLLYHTSGIPFNTIDLFKPGNGSDELENTVKRLARIELEHIPGDNYCYATINYDVLGLIIQKTSGKPYEVFMRENIFAPLGLHNTIFRRSDAREAISSGYKYYYNQLNEFDAPVFRGNAPAGYILSSQIDMERWLNLQLQIIEDSTYTPLILRSHIPDHISKGNVDNTFYAAGWLAVQANKTIFKHSGNNPNFSSSIVLDTSRKTGIVVLANINSGYTQQIADNILKLLSNDKTAISDNDIYKTTDKIAIYILIAACIFILFTFYFLIALIRETGTGNRTFKIEYNADGVMKFAMSLLFLAGLAYCLYVIPDGLYNGLSWDFIQLWAPQSLVTSIRILYLSFLLFFLYFLLDTIYVKSHRDTLYVFIVLSLLSGFGNATIILSINKALDSHENVALNILPYFIFGLYTYLFTRRLLSNKLIILTNSQLFILRKELINKLLSMPFQRFEKIPKENLQVIFNSDTNEVSQLPGTIVQILTGSVTLLCCFLYLATVNIWGLLFSGAVILLVCILYYLISNSAKKTWEESVVTQNRMVKFIDDMILGFKELSLNITKKEEFEGDYNDNSKIYRDKNSNAQLKFSNVFVAGELLFVSIFCFVIFIFPLIFVALKKDEIQTFVLVFLYMTGPVNMIMNSIPVLIRIRVSWDRIVVLRKEFSDQEAQEKLPKTSYGDEKDKDFLAFENISFSYDREKYSDGFNVGPLSCSFHSGEIVFITGGNGSGKSTLAKILTGLYTPDQGTISLNGETISSLELTQKFTAIFSDYHLFEKLYGVKHDEKSEIIQRKLRKLRMLDKLTIEHGVFSTLNLSAGQRKRMALLVSYLDDKPFYLFDEWAADQDVEFRDFFYTELLFELKKQQKIIIVISHDEKYFKIADKMYNMNTKQFSLLK